MSCRFYGKHWAGSTFGLVDQCGNQCAMIIGAYSPCALEINGHTPDETVCPLAEGAPADPSCINDFIRTHGVRRGGGQVIDASTHG